MTGRPLDEQVALVTGAAGGIGAAVARRLAAAGTRLHLLDLDADGLERLEGELGGRVTVHALDVTERSAVDAAVAHVEAERGLHTVVSCAGIAGRGRIEEVDDDLWDRVVRINLSAVYWLCRASVPALRRSGGGTIVNLASAAAHRGLAGSAIYSASKAGVVALTKSIAADHAREGIRAWALCPTAVDTPMFARTFQREPDPQAARDDYLAATTTGSPLLPEQIAGAVAYLAGPDALPYATDPFIT